MSDFLTRVAERSRSVIRSRGLKPTTVWVSRDPVRGGGYSYAFGPGGLPVVAQFYASFGGPSVRDAVCERFCT